MVSKKTVNAKKVTLMVANDSEVIEGKKFRGTERSSRELTKVNTKDTFWTPEKVGDCVEGEFQEYERSEGGKYGTVETIEKDGKKVKIKVSYRAVIADHATGEIIKMPSTKMLNEFFEEMEKGTYVRVTFEGKKLKKDKKKGEENSTYNDYTLERGDAPKVTKKK